MKLKNSNPEDLSKKLDAMEKRIDELERQLADKEFQLEKSKFMMRLLDSATDSVFLHDFEGNFVYVNENAYKTLGYTKEQLMGMNLHDLDVPKYEKLIKLRIKELTEKGESIFEAAHLRKDGSQLPVEIHSKIIEYKDKLLVLSYVRDITERKHIENALVSAKGQYRTLLDNIGVGISFISPKMEILDLNDQMKGWFPDVDVSEKPICYKVFNDPPRKDRCTYCPTFRTLEDGKVHESVTDTPGGDEIINYRIVSSPIKDEDGNVVAAIEMVEDITERQKAAEKLRQSEEKFRAVAESAIDAIITADSKGIITFFNHSLLELFGYTASELFGKPVSIIVPQKHKKGHLNGMKLFESGERQKTGKTIMITGLKKDGTEFPCEMSLSSWKLGEDTYFTSIIRDLTERQKAEEALKESEAEYRAIFENIKSAVAVYNAVDNGSNFIFKDFNKAAEEIDQIRIKDVVGKKVTEVFPSVMEFGLLKAFQRVWKTGKPERLPISIYKDERIEGWRENYVYKLPSGDIVTVYDDLTEIKQYEEELEKNQSRLKSLVKILQYEGGSVKEFLDYTLKEAVQLTESKMGYICHYDDDKKQLVLNTWSREVMKDCSIDPMPTVFNLDETGLWGEPIRQGKPILLNDFQAHHPLKRGYPEGHSTLYKYMTIPVFSGDKIVASVAVANKDTDYTETDVLQLELLMDAVWKVVDRKNAEEALKLSQIRLEDAMDLAHLVDWEFDGEGMIFRFNDRFYSMYGTTADQEGGYLMPVDDYVKNFVHPEDVPAIVNGFKLMQKTGQPEFPEEVEHRIVRRDGETRYVAVHIHFICDDKGKVIGSYGSNQDITHRKIAEEKLKESLEEKEMLLKEIHHRVKNNLMVISSLLNLQSQYIKDKESLDIFKESQNRAKSMALIHERLYRSTDLKKIDFGDYIHTLATDLFNTYVTDPSSIKLNMDVENVMVDINTTVPLGLIVNELVTNSMKHAFPEWETGEINIEFNKKEDLFTLIVKDTGVGFSEGLDFRNTSSLGMQLVNNLVSQIDGEITLDRSRGTEFKITFKEVEYKKRT